MQLEGARSAPDLGERFVVEDLLGAGSFGRVYRAQDRRYGLAVALKVLGGFHPEALRLFKTEFRALAHMSHPNLVALYELHQRGDTWFFSMELVPGWTLSSWAKETPRTAEEIRAALLGAAMGIAALHEAGLLHRDIKPSNVLCARDGRILVGDFGHIGALDAQRRATDERVIATVAYSAPEVWSTAPIGPASDWYSFGIAAFQLLAGALPFDGVPPRLAADGPSPRTRREDVPEDLAALVTALLRRDPEARPGPAEIVRVLAGSTVPQLVSHGAAHRLFGREAELDALSASLGRSRTEGSTLELVLGPSGMGKTSLVDELARRARAAGALVLRGRCHPHDSLSARGLDAVVDALGTHIARTPANQRASLVPDPEPALGRMFPTLRDVLPRAAGRPTRTGTGKEERQAAILGLARVFGRVASLVPVVVVIDDLQWADDDTGSVVVGLLEALRGAPGVLFVGTARDDAESPCLAVLRREVPDRVERTLAPLGDDDAASLARSVLGESAGLDATLAAARGNPFLVLEVATHLRHAGDAPRTSGDVLVDEVLGSRVERLPTSARRMLEIVTLAEVPLPTEVAIRAASLAESDYLGDLSMLRASRLVTPRLSAGRESLEPYHGRVRDAVTRAIAPDVRPALHRAIATALARSPTEAREIIARHYFAAGEMALALEHARAAADDARHAVAFGRAVTMLELAQATGAASPREALEIQLDLADALANAGRGKEAAAQFLALADLDEGHAPEHERRAAEQLLYSGHMAEGTEVLGRVLDRFGLSLPRSRVLSVARVVWSQAFGAGRRALSFDPSAPRVSRPELYGRVDALNAATLGLTMTDPLASAAMQALHLEDAMKAGEPGRLARALAIHLVHSAGGWYEPERSQRLGALLAELVVDTSTPQTEATVALSRAGAAWMEGRFAECLRHGEEAATLLRGASCVGMQWHIDTHHLMELEVLEGMGRWDELRMLLGSYLGDARERGDRFLESNLRSRLRPTMWLAEDRVAEAREEIALARRIWEHRSFDTVALYAGLREVWCSLYEDDAPRAGREADALWKAMQSSLLIRVVFYRDMVRAAHGACLLAVARRGDGAAAAQVGTIARELVETRAPVPRAYASLLEAGLASIAGTSDARARYHRAAEAFVALDMALVAAACRWRAQGATREAATAPPGATLASPARIFAMLAP